MSFSVLNSASLKDLALRVARASLKPSAEWASFSDKTPLSEVLTPYVRARTQQGRRVRALDLSGKDRLLLQAINAMLAASTEELLDMAA